jgi:uncharacterized membrane protein YeiB
MSSDMIPPGDVHAEPQTVVALAAPVAPAERISSIDVLRGFAILGILVINIDLFSMSTSVLQNPMVMGGFEGLDLPPGSLPRYSSL